MEKLQPILTHKFWILFAVALILPIVGYFPTKGDLVAEIDSRKSTLDGAYSGIPSGSGSANQSWIDEIKKRNDYREVRNTESNYRLWTLQESLMVWPSDIAAQMAVCPFRGEISDVTNNEARNVPYRYQDDYISELDQLWKLVDPKADDNGPPLDSSDHQVVSFPYKTIPKHPNAPWEGLPPTWAEIWDCQEDIWLLRSLLSTVKSVNGPATSELDANIREIRQLELFGGKWKTKKKGGGGGGGPKDGGGIPGGMPGGMPGGVGFPGGRGAASAVAEEDSAEFFPPAEFELAYATGRSGLSMSGPPTGGNNNSGGGKKQDPNAIRYLDYQEESLFRQRGFYMSIVIDHQRIPDFLVALTNADWPVQLVRVQRSKWDGRTGAVGIKSGGIGAMASAANPADLGGGGGDTETAIPADTGTDIDLDGGTDPAASFDNVSGSSPNGPSGGGTDLVDADLAIVAVTGVITLYNPVEAPAPAATPAVAAPGTPAGVPAVPTAPGTPAAVNPAPATPAVPGARPSTTPAATGTPTTLPPTTNPPVANPNATAPPADPNAPTTLPAATNPTTPPADPNAPTTPPAATNPVTPPANPNAPTTPPAATTPTTDGS
ncbi:MAG: hypothetical protein CMJ78_12240 [Planctomycetaceae bacterium]|nr:hypothetical protein [Planctomycetaceae bacterium]